MSEAHYNYFTPKGCLVFIGQCILLIFLAFLARETWSGYRQEKLNALFEKEGQPVTIRVANVTHEKKTWKDYIGNSKYIEFPYKDKSYKIRYVQDVLFVMEGTRLELLYDNNIDAFQQPGLHWQKRQIYKTSRLVEWTVLSTFSRANVWLFVCIVLCTILLIFVTGMLSNLTGSNTLARLLELLATLAFLAGALYISYDTYQLFRYIRRIRSDASTLSVPVLDKSRHAPRSPRGDELWISYTYRARVHYRNEDRVIPISGKDYDAISPGTPLNVYYNQSLDEMMSVDYSPGYEVFFFVGMVWIIFIYFCRRLIRSRDSLATA